jgi:FKBP-type peptidyl-prolyl cis-trans isomerase 2
MKCDKNEMQTMLQRLPRVFVCLLMLAGCATQGAHQTLHDHATAGAQEGQVQPGDTASVHYLCRLQSGEVVAATDRVAESQPKSNLYIQREEPGPLPITALSAKDPAQAQAPYEQRSLEEEIYDQIAHAIVGMKEGDTRVAKLTAEDAPPQQAHKYIARLTRVRTRQKEWKMPKGDYEFRAHRTPEVGQEFTYDPDFPGKVESVSDQEVTVRLFATPGAVIETPFGPGRVREEGQDYKMDIEARKGALVRAAAMTGRISDVDDKVITIDFGNPFGGETLLCDVTVEKITDAKTVQSGE